MLGEVFNTHGLESTGADMQRHENFFTAFIANLLKQFIREVEPCRRCGNGTGILGIDRLITAFVGFFSDMLNIGRQRNFAVFI